jgi:hypothetical protein
MSCRRSLRLFRENGGVLSPVQVSKYSKTVLTPQQHLFPPNRLFDRLHCIPWGAGFFRLLASQNRPSGGGPEVRHIAVCAGL